MLKLIKFLFKDLFVLYKNFIHWNISKLLIYISSFLIGILLSLPFFILIFIVFFVSSLEWQSLISYLSGNNSIPLDFMASFLEKPITLLIVGILFILAILSLFLGLSYSKVLIANLNLKYLDGEKIPFFKNIYFSFKTISKYLKILSWSALFLIIPILVFLVGFIIFYISFGGIENITEILNSSNYLYFSLPLLILFIVCLILFLYILYRITFSYIILIDKKNDKKALSYIKKSFKKTGGFKKIFRFFILSLILLLVLLPFDIVGSSLEDNTKRIKDYVNYQNGIVESNDYYYEGLKLDFSDYSKQDLESEYNKNFGYSIFFYIFMFLFIDGLFDMLIVSFYKRELLGDVK